MPDEVRPLLGTGETVSLSWRPSGVSDLSVELKVSGCDRTVALQESPGLAVVALPVALDDIGGAEHLAVLLVGAPHADPRLELDHGALPHGTVTQGRPPLLISVPHQR